MSHTVKRRDVLKASGVTGAGALVGLVEARDAGYGEVRLVEAGVEYDLLPDDRFRRVGVNGDPQYFLRESGDVVLRTPLPAEVERTFRESDTVVATGRIHAPPVQFVGLAPDRELTTRTAGVRVPTDRLKLAEPHVGPEISVVERGSDPVVTVAGERRRTTPGDRLEFALPTRTVRVETKELGDEPADVEGVSDHRVGQQLEFGEVAVEATPTVTVADHGRVSVLELGAVA